MSLSNIQTAEFPLLKHLNNHLAKADDLSGLTLGWHCHLTELTSQAADVLLAKGVKLYLSECNPHTSDKAAIAYMSAQGARIYCGQESCRQVLSHQPQILSDTGLELISTYLDSPVGRVFAACEITTSGITRLRQLDQLRLPVININSGQLKQLIENFHGVGDGLVESLQIITRQDWSGRKAAVIGYGSVGSGVAAYLQKTGLQVMVVDSNPIAQLKAHYDGFAIANLDNALQSNQLIVTASGQENLLSSREWVLLQDQAYIFNVGHWANELDLAALSRLSDERRALSTNLEEFVLPQNKSIFVATGGNPVNVVLLTGSPEPTLIHLTTEILTVSYLAQQLAHKQTLPFGEQLIPPEVENTSARLAVKALGLN